MHRRGTLAMFGLALLTLLVGLAAGCSGGGGSQDQQQQQGGANGGGGDQGGNQGGGQGGGNAPESKISLGTVVFINAEQRTFTLRPNSQDQQQGGEGDPPDPVRYRMTPQATVQLEGEDASVDDMQKGQQAQVEYVVRKGSNRAKSVELFPPEESGDDSGGNQEGGGQNSN